MMVVPDHNSSKVRVMNLPAFYVFLLVLLGTVWIGLFLFFMWGYHCRVVESYELESLKAENTRLSEDLEWMGGRIDSLTSEIEFLTEQDKALRIMADLPEISDETRDVGVGGAAFTYDGFLNDSADPLSLPPSMGADVDQLLREASLLKSSFEEIENTFAEQKDRLDHTPTIMPTTGWFSSSFGRRRDPFTGRRQFHYGVDIANRRGTPIYAPADGKVKHYGNDKNFGRLLVIEHGYGYETRYGHLQKCLVKKGQEVKRGQKIALMGSTGRSTSSHLHYEIKLNGKHQNPFNYFYADVVVD